MRYDTRNMVIVALVVLTLASMSCAPMRPGADTFLTRAEQSLDVAFWSVDSLFRIEKMTPELDKLVPGAHAAVEKMRVDAPIAFTAAINALDAYRTSKDANSEAKVSAAIAVVQSLANDAANWLNKINIAKGVQK